MSRVVAWSVWAAGCLLSLVGSASATGLDFTASELPFGVAFAVLGLGAVSAGVLVMVRVPGNAVGPLLLTLGLGTGALLAAGAYAEASLARHADRLAGDTWAAWFSHWLSFPTFFGATILLLLLFPDGRLVSTRWSGAAWFTVVGVVTATVAAAFTPRRIAPGFDNPLGARGAAGEAMLVLEDVTELLALPVLLIGAAALVARVRRSVGVERQQLKMFASVAVLVGLGLGTTALWSGPVADTAFFVGLAALASLPLVTGVAIMRYGLYGIDVVIRRALVYVPLTGGLVATYLVTVLVLQSLLRPVAGESDLAVAGSTLAVAALFRPLRSRVQAVVDRRFDRRRYDAARTLESFGTRLRDELDLDSLGADLRRVVGETMAPAHVSLWLREDAS